MLLISCCDCESKVGFFTPNFTALVCRLSVGVCSLLVLSCDVGELMLSIVPGIVITVVIIVITRSSIIRLVHPSTKRPSTLDLALSPASGSF